MRRIVDIALISLGMAAALGYLAGEAAPIPRTDTDRVVRGDTAFAVDLYGQLSRSPGNIFMSPYSISTALAMTYAGARGETAKEMATALHFDLNEERLHPALSALDRQLTKTAKAQGVDLYTANALWGQTGEGFLPPFVELVRSRYGAGLNEVDFQKASEAVRQTINSWVAEHTRDKIKDLLRPGSVNDMTRLVLTNAIYFKGKWANPFQKQQTRTEPFFLDGGRKTSVSMMHEDRRFPYLEDRDVQVIELPYGKGALSCVGILPRRQDGLAGVEKSLTVAKLAGWIGGLAPREVSVALPRFKLETEFELSKQLQALGMNRAFDAGHADFSGMNGREDLLISSVVHKAFVDVNEEGTEAAAATAGVAVSAVIMQQRPVFRADHPFLILIRDTASGSILFLGRVSEPLKAE